MHIISELSINAVIISELSINESDHAMIKNNMSALQCIRSYNKLAIYNVCKVTYLMTPFSYGHTLEKVFSPASKASKHNV